MAHGILLGHDAFVATWAWEKYNLFPHQINCAIGIVRQDAPELIGAILLHYFNGINIEMSYYGERTLTPGIARSVSRILLKEYNVARLTVVTSKRNKRLMRSLQRFGFHLEGAQRCFYGREDSARNTGVRFVAFRHDIERVAGHDFVDALNQKQN